jgi:hypothetical protein
MIALGQGMTGLALVMGFALLSIRQVSAAAILLAVQSAAAAVAAIMARQPLMALPPVLLAAGIFLTPGQLATLEPRTVPVGGAKLGVAAATALAILCQSQPGLGLPLAVILLSVLLAATRRHPLMHVMALVGLQNGIVLASTQPAMLLPLACFALPLPLAAGVLVPHLKPLPPAPWHRWLDFGLALMILAATIVVPLDSIASIFAPLLALDGTLRSWQRRNRHAMTPLHRGLALLSGLFPVLAVATSDPVIAWLAILASILSTRLPTLTRRWDDAVLAVLGAGIALFGLVAPPPSILGAFSTIAGFIAIGSVVPDLAPVLAVQLLRLADQAPWAPSIEALTIGAALLALMACATLHRRAPSPAVLQQSNAAIAVLAIGLGQPDGRLAALVLLILLILCRSATRLAEGHRAALAGATPLGVFPGLVLVVLAVSSHHAWLLLPLGAALVPILLATPPLITSRTLTPTLGWLPLALALLAGYCAPDGLVRWWRLLTAGYG